MQGKIIRMIAAYKGVPLSEIAQKMGKTTSNFYQILARDDFRESELKRMAEILGCDFDIVFTDRDTGKRF